MKNYSIISQCAMACKGLIAAAFATLSAAVLSAPAQVPLFLGGGQPLVMLTMSRDHKLYYEAYNDASDINGDGVLDVGYKPATINYFGYFDSFKCYTHDGSRFNVAATTADKRCSGQWSGDFLNYVTMTRMDAIRKVLYGGYRSTDGDALTVLERAFIPQDAHSWGKEYESVARDGYDISQYTPLAIPTAGTRHLFANTTPLGTTTPLMRVLQNTNYRVWEWLSIERPVSGDECVQGGTRQNCGAKTDYAVRVEVCKTGFLESDCRGYPRGSASPTVYRPTGLLHEFGEDHSMAFGLLTGSYRHNLQGGVLRKNISNFANEVDATTGKFLTDANGIVKTIDSLRVTGFAGNYEYSCGWITTRPINDGECRMWGNPLGEMMYEALRYLAGAAAPTAAYTYTQNDDDGLSLPKPAWQNPYRTSGGYGWCSKPFQMVISDINPSYDTALPGSSFGDATGELLGRNLYSNASTSLDVSATGNLIWNNETESTSVFIGHSKAGGVDNYDGAPTAKTVSSFATLRGLAPEEPTKQGSYYSAAVAHFGNTNRITNPENLPASGRRQNVQTFSVALASPLPKIEIPIAALNKKVTIVPFAKSVAGSSIDATQGQFQPTNQIVDFYIDTIRNVPGFPADNAVNAGRPFYKFRINFEDVEQGADHDMDAIAEYNISLLADNSVQVKVDSTYAAGGIAQHMGYVISGTTADGTYLVVRDCDTANAGGGAPCTNSGNNPAADPDYFLDTPNVAGALPLTSTRTFNAGTASAQFLKHDPLWYAAKWGGFTDLPTSQDGLPLQTSEWDRKRSDGTIGADGVPDNYYLVTNAGELKNQLRSAFSEISARTTSASAIAQNSTRLDTDTMIYQARFNTQDWTGQLRAFQLGLDGTVDTVEAWEASSRMPAHTARNIVTWDDVARVGNVFKITNDSGQLTAGQRTALGIAALPLSSQIAIVDYLRGDRSNEQQSGGVFRNRSSILGDIVNSDPVYVYAENFGYESLPESLPVNLGDPNRYVHFRDVVKPQRRKMIYVGANDGMVHGFDASSDVNNGGVEQFAFVPRAALSPIMASLSQPNYNHQYLVDGPLFAGDAYFGGAWKTVLLGTTGAGNAGKSVFALDVTDPDQFSASSVLWEISSTIVTDLGYPMGQPIIGRMPNGRWAAIFGNGWESSVGKSRLIVAYLDPDLSNGWTLGTDYCVLTTDDTLNNGLGTPALLDTNRDGVIDYVYAGDLQGNLWRFKFEPPGNQDANCPTSGNNAKWIMDRKLFQTPAVSCRVKAANGTVSLCSPASTQRQPITGPIEIGPPPTGQTNGYMLLFGTGQYYQQSDVNNMTEQAFYAVWDEMGNQNTAVPLADLVEQTITNEGQITVANANPPPADLTFDYRITSSNAVAYPTKKGWYMKLRQPPVNSPSYQGERVVSAPLLRAGRVVFTTLIPSNDSCSFGGDSWIMEVDLYSGGRTSAPSFDLNNDRSFSIDDMVNSMVVSGIRSREGIVKTPAVISAGGVEYKYASGTSGNIEKVVEKGSAAVKRTSWRQIQ